MKPAINREIKVKKIKLSTINQLSRMLSGKFSPAQNFIEFT